jgi:hypothetical protein
LVADNDSPKTPAEYLRAEIVSDALCVTNWERLARDWMRDYIEESHYDATHSDNDES